jgi:dGTPase
MTAGPPRLAHLRFPVERARGRRYPELPHPYRNDFQRDRDRVVHSRAFRRLENKTQVFTAAVSDHFRNRLTHTLEVSQIARSVAGVLGLDQDLTEALALAHDIGHPPFAHAGEAELDRLMRGFGDRFEHNRHALRIVEQFEQRYARHPGLNLTFEVREGIVKHSRDLAPGEDPDLEEYLPGLRPPLEAQLIDLCDEIAYNTADLEDAYAAGLLSLDELRRQAPAAEPLAAAAETMYPGAPEKLRVFEITRGLINALVDGLVRGTAAAAAGLADAEAVRRHPARVAGFLPEAAELNRQLKQYLRERIYEAPELVATRSDLAAKLRRLFEYYLARPEAIPAAFREEFASEPPHRLVCDYIAGMTDRFFLRTYDQLPG